jgi:hypothetical protein
MDVRKADAAFRRLAIGALVAGTCMGAALIGALDRYRGALAGWVRSDAGRSAERSELILAVFATLLLAPLVAMAAYLSSVGGRAVRMGEFPPPGSRVIWDTAIVRGHEALSRGRVLQGVAVFLCAAALVIGFLLWRLASLFADRMR